LSGLNRYSERFQGVADFSNFTPDKFDGVWISNARLKAIQRIDPKTK
jgi:hypothetical protein